MGLESSGKIASVAMIEDGEIIGEYMLNAGITHSQTFLPLVDHLLQMTKISLKEIGGIAVSQGPGSYTGLRIGIATAKGLALAHRLPVVGISTLEGLAQNIVDFSGRIFTLMFARAQEVYFAEFQACQDRLKLLTEPKVMVLAQVLDQIKKAGQSQDRIGLVGDGFYQFEAEFRGKLDPQLVYIPAKRRHQVSAASIALLGQEKLLKGQGIPGDQLVPSYLKKTQAERECSQ